MARRPLRNGAPTFSPTAPWLGHGGAFYVGARRRCRHPSVEPPVHFSRRQPRADAPLATVAESLRGISRHKVSPVTSPSADSNLVITELDARGEKPVISQHPRRAQPLADDEELYQWRHLIENFFCKLKEFKQIAMRADNSQQPSYIRDEYLNRP
jgi:hypothetical protein